jgi:multisubunit Na+/H+ antiporter MnhG subunit
MLTEAVGVSMGVIQSQYWSLFVFVDALLGFLFLLVLSPVSRIPCGGGIKRSGVRGARQR